MPNTEDLMGEAERSPSNGRKCGRCGGLLVSREYATSRLSIESVLQCSSCGREPAPRVCGPGERVKT